MLTTTEVSTPQPVSAEELERLLGPSPDPDLLTVGREAADVLGYTVLKEELRDDERTLLALLREHDVPVYRPEEVETYMDAKVDEAYDLHERKLSKHNTHLMLGAFIVMVLGAASYLVFGSDLLGVLSILIAAIIASQVDESQISASWDYAGMDLYEAPIPIAALRVATALQRSAPNVCFSVADFRVGEVIDDPLLFVHLGDASFCIAVWGEPGFNAPLVR